MPVSKLIDALLVFISHYTILVATSHQKSVIILQTDIFKYAVLQKLPQPPPRFPRNAFFFTVVFLTSLVVRLSVRNSLPLSTTSTCEAECSDQSGRTTLVDCACGKQHSFQHGDRELAEGGLTWCQTCGQKALRCAALVVKVADSTRYFFIALHFIFLLVFRSLPFLFIRAEWPRTR